MICLALLVALLVFAVWQVFGNTRKALRGAGRFGCDGCCGSCGLCAGGARWGLAPEGKDPEGEDGVLGVTLDEVRPGGRALVKRNRAVGAVQQRIMDMGFHRGVQVEVVRNAPLVDPVEFMLDGQFVSLRHAEARLIEVEAS